MLKVLLVLSMLVLLSRGVERNKTITQTGPYLNDAMFPGDIFRWINLDALPHTVTHNNASGPRIFDSGLLVQGETFQVTLTEPGAYPYLCTLHANMSGVLSVCNSATEIIDAAQGTCACAFVTCGAGCCQQGQVCQNSTCVSGACPNGLVQCHNTCVNTTSDTLNCGACNTTCAVGNQCVNSVCSASSVPPQNFTGDVVFGPNNSTSTVLSNLVVQIGQDVFFNDILPAVSPSALVDPTKQVRFTFTVSGLAQSELLTVYISQNGASAAAVRNNAIAPASPAVLTAASNSVSVTSRTAAEFFVLFRLSTVSRKRDIQATLATLTISTSQQIVTICPTDQSLCGSVCHNLATDSFNCGSCGNQCDPGFVCNAGNCSTVCAPPLTNCNGFCVNMAIDYLHCSSCNIVCPIGQICSSSSCIRDPVHPERFRSLIGAVVVEGPTISTASVSGIFLPHGTEKFYSSIISPVNPALLTSPTKLVKFTFRISGLVSTDSVTIYISQNGTFKANTISQAIAPANPAVLTQANNEISVTSRKAEEFVVLFRLTSSSGLKRSIFDVSETQSSTVTLQAIQQIIDQTTADVHMITVNMANLLPITN